MNGKDDMGETPLHRTPHNDDIGVIQLLLENGADVNARDDGGGTPLHHNSMGNIVGAVQTLIQNEADVNTRNTTGVAHLWM